MKRLRISGIVNDSIVDGPGLRFAIFTQGCPHNCPGCHNPQTHSLKGGKKISINKLYKKIKENGLLGGVTFSGGEPFLQAKTLLPLAKKLKEDKIELASYTGFLFEELLNEKVPGGKELLSQLDILIDGKFVQSLKSLDLAFKGSSNQRTIDVQKSLKKGKAVLSKDPRWNKN